MRNRYAVRRFFGWPSGSLQNVEKTVWTERWVNARFSHLSCDRNASTGVFLNVDGYTRIFYQMRLAKAVLNLLSSLVASISSHRNKAELVATKCCHRFLPGRAWKDLAPHRQ